jgi:hypothetical protein
VELSGHRDLFEKAAASIPHKTMRIEQPSYMCQTLPRAYCRTSPKTSSEPRSTFIDAALSSDELIQEL